MNLSKKIKLIRLVLILMATFGVFFVLLQGLEFYDRWRSYKDISLIIITLPISLVIVIFSFILAEKLYKGKRWAWYASFCFFCFFTIGDLSTIFLGKFDVGLIIVAIVHGLMAYLLYIDKKEYMSFSDHSKKLSQNGTVEKN